MWEVVPWIGEAGVALGGGMGKTSRALAVCLGADGTVDLSVTLASCWYDLTQVPSFASVCLPTCAMQPIIVLLQASPLARGLPE